MSKNRLFVVPHEDGWAVKRPNAQRASSVHQTQQSAQQRAKEQLAGQGGGEVTVQGTDGKFRDSDTIAPANDPYPPKDTKH